MSKLPSASPEAHAAVGIGWRHPHYEPLLGSRPDLDFIEVHSENFFAEGGASLAVLLEGRAHYPVSLHGVGLSLGSACGVDSWHLAQLARLVKRIDPVRVSDHASFARVTSVHASPSSSPIHAADLLPIPWTQPALDVICTNVSQVQDRLRRSIAIENLSAYVHWRAADMSEPEFLMALTRRTGCQLLIDVNNLYVNALNDQRQFGSGIEPVTACCNWLDAIEACVVAEVHLAGHHDGGGLVIDDHGSHVAEPVWQIYRHAIERFGAVPTLVEWDTDIPPLEVLLEEAQHARFASRSGPACRRWTTGPEDVRP